MVTQLAAAPPVDVVDSCRPRRRGQGLRIGSLIPQELLEVPGDVGAATVMYEH